MITSFCCCDGPPQSAPAWVLDLHRAGEPWAAIFEMVADSEEAEAARVLEEDTADRLAGRCDLCAEWSGCDGLVIDGGLAVCTACATSRPCSQPC
jgi:hypothetical protein